VGSDVLTPPRVSPGETGTGPASGLGRPCSVIVMNDNHNTFEGVATILSQYVPGVDYAKGMAFAKTIHSKGQATVWRGDHERAELVWEQLKDAGLTMAPLTDG
jgi:ATP-dependent Clp protease adaptor protein ClpS